jgi:hypothetical protein
MDRFTIVLTDPVRLVPLSTATAPALIVGRADPANPGAQPEVDFGFDPRVSRRHARLQYQAGQWFIEDLDSRHGTHLNGEPIRSKGAVPLAPGARIQTGQTRWTLIPEEWLVACVSGVVVFGPCAPVINYAWYHCGLACAGPLQVWNPQSGPSRPLELGFEIIGYSERAIVKAPIIAGGESIVADPVRPRLDVSRLRTQVTPERAELCVFADGSELREARRAVWLVGAWDWPQQAMGRTAIAACVCPRHPVVEEIVREAEASLNGPTFEELWRAGDPEAERRCLRALYECLARRKIHYEAPRLHTLADGMLSYQTIYPPHEMLPRSGPARGTCLDLTLLFSACLERAGLHSLMVFVGDDPEQPGHCFPGCWLGGASGLKPVLEGVERLRAMAQADILAVEITEATLREDRRRQPTDFDGAMRSAQESLNQAGWACAINVRAVRPPYGGITPMDCPYDTVVEKAFEEAKALARRKRRPVIETTHLFLGILQAEGELAKWLFQRCGRNLVATRSALFNAPSRNFRDCQRLAAELAWQAGSGTMRETDLLWALLLKADDSLPFNNVCATLGLDLQRLARALEEKAPRPVVPASLPAMASGPVE